MSTTPATRTPGATVALTKNMLDSAESVTAMMQLPELQERWVAVYEKISGRPDGVMRFEAEKMLFAQLISGNKKLSECDRFSIYGAMVELAISGLSLRDGLTYIIPFGKKAQFMVGWQGRLEQMLEIPNIIHVSPPQVVYDCDIWDFEKGMKTIIHTHKPAPERPADAKIIHTYMIVHFSHGVEVYDMDRTSTIAIRDNYSKSYRSYMDLFKKPENADKKLGDTLKLKLRDYDVDVEAPMWITSEDQAFKKTLVKRAWKSMKKLPKQEILDEKFAAFARENPGAEFADPDETQNPHIVDPKAQAEAVNEVLTEFTIVNRDEVDTGTGEVVNPAAAQPEKPKTTRKAAAPKTAVAEPEIPAGQGPETQVANADSNTAQAPASNFEQVDTSEGF